MTRSKELQRIVELADAKAMLANLVKIGLGNFRCAARLRKRITRLERVVKHC